MMGLLDIPWFTEAIKKRSVRYLLQRYLGHFFSEKLTLEQLSVELYDGTGCLKDLTLDVDGLNEELIFLPFKFTDGCSIQEIRCSIPWSSLMTDSCSLEIKGASFFCSINPSYGKDEQSKDLFESSYLSKSMMSSSMQMAEEIASAEDEEEEEDLPDHQKIEPFQGIEVMAQLIDSVLRRVKVTAIDTTFTMKTSDVSSLFPGQSSLHSKSSSSHTSSSPESSVEFKIKHLRCEEDMANEKDKEAFKCNTPGNIDKILTLEGLDISINGRAVAKIGGKHTIKIKASQIKSELLIFLGSPLLTVLTSHELEAFFQVFCPSSTSGDSDSPAKLSSGHHRPAALAGFERQMSDADFARIEKQLQEDVMTQSMMIHSHLASGGGRRGSHQQQAGHNKSNAVGVGNWGGTASSVATDSDRFQEIHLDEDQRVDPLKGRRTSLKGRTISVSSGSSSDPNSSGNDFSMFIKIPGIYMCLLPNDPDEEQEDPPEPIVPMIKSDYDTPQFSAINACLDDLVGNRTHLRIIALTSQVDVNRVTDITVKILDGMILEQVSGAPSKLPLLWSEPQERTPSSPKYIIEISPGNNSNSNNNRGASTSEATPTKIRVEGTETTCLTFDPTIFERLDDYLPHKGSGEPSSSSSPLIDLKVESKVLRVNLLFPIPDLRDPEVEEVPDVSSLRSESVLFVTEDFKIKTDLKTTTIKFNSFKASLEQKGQKEGIKFAEAKRGVHKIRVDITNGPGTVSIDDDSHPEDEEEQFDLSNMTMGDSVYFGFKASLDQASVKSLTDVFPVKNKIIKSGNRSNQSPSTDTPEEEAANNSNNNNNNEQIIGPSDRKNAKDFTNQARNVTGLQIDFIIPSGDIELDAEQLELIYNRIANDLVMWSPKKKRSLSTPLNPSPAQPATYKPCFSNVMGDSIDSDTSFQSIEESPINDMINTAVVSIHIHELTLTALKQGKKVEQKPSQKQQTNQSSQQNQQIKGQNVLMNLILGMNEGKTTVMFLNGDKVSFTQSSSTVIDTNCFIDRPQSDGSNGSLLDFSLDITRQQPDFKKIKIAIGLTDALLMKTDTDVFTSFWKFINVTDEDVLGYVPPTIQTELHILLINGAVVVVSEAPSPDPSLATRPALLTFDDFYLTSMVVVSNNMTILRIILEDAAIHLAKSMTGVSRRKTSLNKRVSSIDSSSGGFLPSSIMDYVCVMDSGLTDLSVSMKEDGRIELKVSNNVINVRTCADSLHALCHLILQLASSPSSSSASGVGGSSSLESLQEEQTEDQSEEDGNEKRRSASKASKPVASYNVVKDVVSLKEGKLLTDAINECMTPTEEDDDGSMSSIKSCDHCESLSTQKMIDESTFCILEDDVGTGITSPTGSSEPRIRVVTNDPITIRENHFTSTRSRPLPDIVKETMQRFLLEELTVIFNFYGGRDFDEETLAPASSTTSINVTASGGEASSGIPVEKVSSLGMNKTSSTGSLLEKEVDSISYSSGKVSFRNSSSPSGKEGELRVRFEDEEPQNNLWTSLNLTSGAFDSSPKTRSSGFPSPKTYSGYSGGTGYIKTLGGRNRDRETCVLVSLSKVKSLFETFEATYDVSWRFILLIQEIEVLDKVSRSVINKMLYEYTSESMPKRNSANMFSIKAVSKKNPDDQNDEADIRVSAKPLRVNIDQDTLMFLIDFFSSIANNPVSSVASSSSTSNLNINPLVSGSNSNIASPSSPITSSRKSLSNQDLDLETKNKIQEDQEEDEEDNQEEDSEEEEEEEEEEAEDDDETSETGDASAQVSLSPLDKKSSVTRRDSISSNKSYSSQQSSSSSKPPTIYVKSFIFAPDVPIRLDYTGKRLNLDQGTPGLLMGLAQLNKSELKLKRLCNKHGILGIDRVLQYALNEWQRDIKRHQLPNILGSVGPMQSVIQLVQGIRDLFVMPIQQYQKDKRLVRGLQKGATSFSSSTAMALIDLTNRCFNLIQTTAQFAHDVVSPPHHHVRHSSSGSGGGVPSSSGHHYHRRHSQTGAASGQPRDFREGMTNALYVVKEGFEDTYRHVTTAGSQAEDIPGKIGGVLREVPSSILSVPIVIADGSQRILTGVRNQVVPNARKEDQDKYKAHVERKKS